jgi:hypothetical protein
METALIAFLKSIAGCMHPQMSIVLDTISVVGYTRKDQIRNSNFKGEMYI